MLEFALLGLGVLLVLIASSLPSSVSTLTVLIGIVLAVVGSLMLKNK